MSGADFELLAPGLGLCAVILLTGLLGKQAISFFEWLAGCVAALAFVVLS